MSYSSYLSSTPSRPIRIMLGASMVSFGLIFGALQAVHDFHLSSLVQGEPVEMDWETLVEDGFGDHPHIRLVNVRVLESEVETVEFTDDEEQDEWLDHTGYRSDFQHSSYSTATVVPIGVYGMGDDDRVQVASGDHHISEASRQASETDSIEGMVSTYGTKQMVRDILSVFGEESTEPDQEDETIRYTITPIDGTPDLTVARDQFVFAGLMVALGLILCGSGGPGVWCCWYAPLPSLLSLVGYPMRYGRGSLPTRVAYVSVGVFLMGWGVHVLILQGNFGSADGSPVFHALGFASLFIGLGSVLAVPFQITIRALSPEPNGSAYRKPKRMSWDQACSMEPVIEEIEYVDCKLSTAGPLPLGGELKEKAVALEASGFTKADPSLWDREFGATPAAVQLGCEGMVVCDLESSFDSDKIEAKLISILATGIPIITLSANSSIKQKLSSEKYLIRRSESSDPVKMLSEHLEVVIGEAESRDTVVVELEQCETHDLVYLSRRALAETQGMVNNQFVIVGPKCYGRFHCPPAPVHV